MSARQGWKFGHRPPQLTQALGTLPVDTPLMVVESADAYFVAVAGDADDWLVRFERSDAIDAGGWADNMVRTYNRRLAQASPGRASCKTQERCSSSA
jgi:hypothetical protein